MSDPQSPLDQTASGTLTEAHLPSVPPGKSNKHRRISHEEWEGMFQAWRGGERNKTRLAERFQVTFDTVHKYVEKGLPVNGWISFKDRLRVEENVTAQTQAKIAEGIAKDVTDEYGKVREETMKLLRAMRAVCTSQVVKLGQTLEKMPMTRTTVHYDVDGKGNTIRRTVERPLDAMETASVARALSTAISVSSKMESLWLGGPTERIDNIPESEKLSEAEVDYVNKAGELPPGMTIEQFILKAGRAFGVPFSQPQN